jgi:DNA polymerase IV
MRRILHIDMDAFYASVEQRDNPAIRGKPVAVGGDPTKRGVVAAASYEARAYGVRSAIPMSRAVRLCPALIIIHPDFQKYRTVSEQVFKIYREVTPLVEPLSLDEAYLDVTENAWHEPLGVNVAKRIKHAIKDTTGLTASAGVAPNKFLAKIASGWQKPDGLTVIAPERIEAFLHGLPVDALWGVGPKTAERLRAHGIDKLVDVRTKTLEELRQIVGSSAEWLRDLSRGHDDRAVEPNQERKSVGSECTYESDLTDLARIRDAIREMAGDAARWLDKHAVFARTVVIKVRYDDFTTVTRSQSDPQPTRDPDAIATRAVALLDKTEAGRRPIRLLGVSLHNLEESDSQKARRAARDDEPRLPLD